MRLVILLLSGGLLAGQRAYFKLLAGMSDIGKNFEVLAEYTSVFGNIKVLAVYPEGEGRKPAMAYLQDGIIQNMVTADGQVLDHTELHDAPDRGLCPHGRATPWCWAWPPG